MTRVIGLTGGIGSGKSTVSRMLAELGAVIIDADKVGHETFKPHTEAWRDVVAAFGEQVLTPSGEIDRRKLAEIVFNRPECLARLNQIMHPRMYQMVKAKIEQCRQQGATVVVLEAAALIEAGWASLVDEVWITFAPESIMLERVKKERGLAGDQTLARIRSQLSSEERLKHADVVIDNTGSLDELRAKVKALWERVQTGDDQGNSTAPPFR